MRSSRRGSWVSKTSQNSFSIDQTLKKIESEGTAILLLTFHRTGSSVIEIANREPFMHDCENSIETFLLNWAARHVVSSVCWVRLSRAREKTWLATFNWCWFALPRPLPWLTFFFISYSTCTVYRSCPIQSIHCHRAISITAQYQSVKPSQFNSPMLCLCLSTSLHEEISHLILIAASFRLKLICVQQK